MHETFKFLFLNNFLCWLRSEFRICHLILLCLCYLLICLFSAFNILILLIQSQISIRGLWSLYTSWSSTNSWLEKLLTCFWIIKFVCQSLWISHTYLRSFSTWLNTLTQSFKYLFLLTFGIDSWSTSATYSPFSKFWFFNIRLECAFRVKTGTINISLALISTERILVQIVKFLSRFSATIAPPTSLFH